VPVEGWFTEERARTLLKLSGQSFDKLKAAAIRKDFRPVTLPARASFTVNNSVRRVKSQNVVAKLEGSDPQLKDQVLVYTAHWDHLGKDPKLQGDQVFNGALDNATGTAGLLELARAYSKLPVAPRRSVLFLAVTAEEQGLLGSKWYAENPLYPLAQTVANINMDGLGIWGPTSDVVLTGKGQSTLDDVLAAEAAKQGRAVVQEPTPEKGFYYRSDHFEFAKVGVPALYADGGVSVIGKPEGWGEQRQAEYIARDYHKVSDEVRDEWDFSGAAQDMALLFRVGLAVTEQDALPQWNAGSEFKARRDAMMKKE
jgi:Zn-dependent M28 family amino/carboxypeptidase